jgi:hypothetical protein
MYRKLFISLGTIGAGLAWSGGYAQATDLVQEVATFQLFEIAQSSGSGGRPEDRAPAAAESTGSGTHSGVLGSVAPSGAKPDPSLGHKGPGNMDTSKGARTGSEIRPGDGGSNSPGSAARSGSSGTGGGSGGSDSGTGTSGQPRSGGTLDSAGPSSSGSVGGSGSLSVEGSAGSGNTGK